MVLNKQAWLTSFAALLFILALFWALYPDKYHNEKQVYSTVLGELKDKIPVTEFTFYSHPSNCRGVSHSDIPQADKAAFKHFYIENDVVLGEPLYLYFLRPDYQVLDEQDSLRLFHGEANGRKSISRKLINLSRIGFNLKKTRALLCVESKESGDLVYLEQHNGKWQLTKWQYVW